MSRCWPHRPGAPVTTADVQLEATFENGASVVGESHIFRCKKEQDAASAGCG